MKGASLTASSQLTHWIIDSLEGETEWRTSVWYKRIPALVGLLLIATTAFLGSILIQYPRGTTGLAQSSTEPQKVRVSNFAPKGFSVSWLTDEPTAGFVKLTSPEPLLFLDDRDQEEANTRDYTHHVTLRGLKSQTTYHFKIGSGGHLYDNHGNDYQASTSKEIAPQSPADPTYGRVVTQTGEPMVGALVYTTLQGGTPLSTLVSPHGTWLVALNQSWTTDLSSPLSYPNRGAHLSLIVESGAQGRSVGEVLTGLDEPVPLITLGQDFSFVDLSQAPPEVTPTWDSPTPAPTTPMGPPSLDLNGDGVVNTSDLGILRQAIGENSSDTKFDLNQDGSVDDNDTSTLLDNWGSLD